MTLVHWEAEQAARFGRAELAFRHSLHERPMFSDEGLEEVLDRYPRDKLGVFTMGDDPVDWRSWRRGSAERNMTGSRLLEATKTGRLWLNLRETNQHLVEYSALSDEIFGDMERHVPGLRTFKRDVGLLISSANAQVFYHFDVPPVTLWGLRGEKTLYVYPPHAPFLEDVALEKLVLREAAEQVAFDPSWDERAEVFHMKPGDMISWRQNAPHRVVNGPMLNVSLSLEYMTPEALMRANVIYANALLRRNAGLQPRVQSGFGPVSLAKVGLARAAKVARRNAPTRTAPPPSFRLDATQPGLVTGA
jgi:hypothetical protein